MIEISGLTMHAIDAALRDPITTSRGRQAGKKVSSSLQREKIQGPVRSHEFTGSLTAALRKDEILPFATIRMDLESVMKSEIRQRKTNTIRSHLYVEYF